MTESSGDVLAENSSSLVELAGRGRSPPMRTWVIGSPSQLGRANCARWDLAPSRPPQQLRAEEAHGAEQDHGQEGEHPDPPRLPFFVGRCVPGGM